MFAMATTAEATEIVRAPLITGQETGFWLHPGDTVEINFYPYQQGNRMFSTWHADLSYLLKPDDPKYGPPIIEFAWKDMANPNDQWHVWRSVAVEYYWSKTTQILYSGSNTIGYRFRYETYTENIIYIHAIVQ
ncbi:MAG: hypothetical protein P1P85_02735 [Patescibacteria group bacterium]|nr:hypothetical protein [Patescibacteria group bacterium]